MSLWQGTKVDHEDHFQRPGFLHTIMCFSRVQSIILLKNLMLLMFKKPQKLKGLTVNLVQGLFKRSSQVQIFCFFVERNLIDSSYTLWNKFQDYGGFFFPELEPSLEILLKLSLCKFYYFNLSQVVWPIYYV